ncbi:MAG: hypothetical protein EPN39_17015 [Chitinophagaceae bacterium]|nr:MAG: hypothetical protein EPN39_17015 [Chitinophagaceae bacterium]
MKNKILYGWSPRRVLYLVLGIAVIAYAVIAKEWWGALLGAYFAAMGLFSFGCAAGNCSYEPRRRYTNRQDEQPFEEIKAK